MKSAQSRANSLVTTFPSLGHKCSIIDGCSLFREGRHFISSNKFLKPYILICLISMETNWFCLSFKSTFFDFSCIVVAYGSKPQYLLKKSLFYVLTKVTVFKYHITLWFPLAVFFFFLHTYKIPS